MPRHESDVLGSDLENVMVSAIVVLFHPDQEALDRLLSSLARQVDRVFAIDNTPGSTLTFPTFVGRFAEMVSYIPLGVNKGIAAAQNKGIELCTARGVSHILLLDQDSIVFPDTVQRLLSAEMELLHRGERVAAVCPQIIDERTGRRPAAVHYAWCFAQKIWVLDSTHQLIATDSLIASGSLIRTEVLHAVGPMRDDLFIEYVDTEWAFRARSMGYRSYCATAAILMHRVGERTMTILGKDIYLYSPVRYQYKLRNAAYLLRLRTMGWSWRSYAAAIIPYHLMLFTLVSRNRREVFASLLKAIGDGWREKLGEIATL